MTPEQWDTILYFRPFEIVCRHCQLEEMDYGFMVKLDRARKIFRQPIRVTSGFRCAEHNVAIGGSPTSSHLTGLAADLWDRKEPVYRASLIDALRAAGFTQFEVSRDGHVHVMDDPDKPQPFLGVEP